MNNQELRKIALSEVQLSASKRRFGLFSQPPSLAIGDDSKFRTIIHPRSQDGKPITQPRNFATSPNKNGVIKSSYFNVPQSIHIGDPFMESARKNIIYENSKYYKGKYHQNQFVPNSAHKTLASSSYKYQAHGHPVEPKTIEKDENGRVKINPRNFQTNPCTKVQTELLKNPPHLIDPYERKQQLERQQNKKKRFKIAETYFKPMSHSLSTFSKPSEVYNDTTIPIPPKKLFHSRVTENKMNHQVPFRLSKNHGSSIGKFPKYIEQNPIPTKFHKKEKSDQQVFKPTRGPLSKPSPSIAYSTINIRRSVHF